MLLPCLPHRGETGTAADELEAERALQRMDNVSCDILWLSRAQERGFRPGTDTMRASEKRIFFGVLQSSYTGHLKVFVHRGKDSLHLYSCEETYCLWLGFPAL